MRSYIALAAAFALAAVSQGGIVREWRVDAGQGSAGAKFAGGHSFWFANALVPGGGQQYAFDALGGRLAEIDTNGDGVTDELRLTGRIQSQQTDAFGFDVDVTFVAQRNLAGQLQGQTFNGAAGPLDGDDMGYYSMDAARATLAGIGSANGGQAIDLFDFAGGTRPFQFGYGASGSSGQLGLRGLFGFELDDELHRGDVSIALASMIPAPAAVGLGLIGLGSLAGMRRYFA